MRSSRRILCSANDAGGAQAIFPVVKELSDRGYACAALIDGPARNIIAGIDRLEREPKNATDAQLDEKIRSFDPDALLIGTSSGPSIERRVLKLMRTPSVAVLDFWSNYAERFSEHDHDLAYLPSIVCVMDEQAKRGMVEAGIPGDRVAVTGNPHLETWQPLALSEDPFRILFISQPVREVDGMKYGFDQHDAIRGAIEALESLPPSYHIVIRLHPKDDPHSYDAYLGTRVSISSEPTLELALSHAGLIVGMFSPVLIQAAALRKFVISFQPHGTIDDPLITNSLGLTPKAHSTEELRLLLLQYVSGSFSRSVIDIHEIWPPGATERVIQVIEGVVESHQTISI